MFQPSTWAPSRSAKTSSGCPSSPLGCASSSESGSSRGGLSALPAGQSIAYSTTSPASSRSTVSHGASPERVFGPSGMLAAVDAKPAWTACQPGAGRKCGGVPHDAVASSEVSAGGSVGRTATSPPESRSTAWTTPTATPAAASTPSRTVVRRRRRMRRWRRATLSRHALWIGYDIEGSGRIEALTYQGIVVAHWVLPVLSTVSAARRVPRALWRAFFTALSPMPSASPIELIG